MLCVLLALLLLAGCDPSAFEDWEPPEQPEILDASADCDPNTGGWELWALVDHPAGPEAVTEVWCDTYEVQQDSEGRRVENYLLTAGLAYQGEGAWMAAFADGEFLNCFFEGQFMYIFSAVDAEGDGSSVAIEDEGNTQ